MPVETEKSKRLDKFLYFKNLIRNNDKHIKMRVKKISIFAVPNCRRNTGAVAKAKEPKRINFFGIPNSFPIKYMAKIVNKAKPRLRALSKASCLKCNENHKNINSIFAG